MRRLSSDSLLAAGETNAAGSWPTATPTTLWPKTSSWTSCTPKKRRTCAMWWSTKLWRTSTKMATEGFRWKSISAICMRPTPTGIRCRTGWRARGTSSGRSGIRTKTASWTETRSGSGSFRPTMTTRKPRPNTWFWRPTPTRYVKTRLGHTSDALLPKDGKLTKEEILESYDVFVGSQATDFGDALLRHEEFWRQFRTIISGFEFRTNYTKALNES